MPRRFDTLDPVERGMDIWYYDPARPKPKIARPGKVSSILPTGRVHVTIFTDPDLDRNGPVETVRNIRLLHNGQDPDLHEAYARLRFPDGVILKRPPGRPPKTAEVQWAGKQA